MASVWLRTPSACTRALWLPRVPITPHCACVLVPVFSGGDAGENRWRLVCAPSPMPDEADGSVGSWSLIVKPLVRVDDRPFAAAAAGPTYGPRQVIESATTSASTTIARSVAVAAGAGQKKHGQYSYVTLANMVTRTSNNVFAVVVGCTFPKKTHGRDLMSRVRRCVFHLIALRR